MSENSSATEMPKEEKVLPMMDLFSQYWTEIEKIKSCNGAVIAAAVLTGFDTILRYADYVIKKAVCDTSGIKEEK